MHEPYLTDVIGRYLPGHLEILWRDEPRAPDAALDRLVSRTWERQVETRRRSGGMLFNGQLARYLRHREVSGKLVVEVGPTDYANFMATNLFNWRRGDELGWHLFSNPIGTTCLPLTADGFLLLGRRNHRVAYHPDFVHTIGGALEASDRGEDGTIDGFASIARELREELHVQDQELGLMACRGLIRDPSIRQPELVFDICLAVDHEQLVRRFDPGDPHQEHRELLACRDDPDAIVAFFLTQLPITPVAVGALCLHGRRRFGEAWHDHAVGMLAAAAASGSHA